jgi:hypothetical protein
MVSRQSIRIHRTHFSLRASRPGRTVLVRALASLVLLYCTALAPIAAGQTRARYDEFRALSSIQSDSFQLLLSYEGPVTRPIRSVLFHAEKEPPDLHAFEMFQRPVSQRFLKTAVISAHEVGALVSSLGSFPIVREERKTVFKKGDDELRVRVLMAVRLPVRRVYEVVLDTTEANVLIEKARHALEENDEAYCAVDQMGGQFGSARRPLVCGNR